LELQIAGQAVKQVKPTESSSSAPGTRIAHAPRHP